MLLTPQSILVPGLVLRRLWCTAAGGLSGVEGK